MFRQWFGKAIDLILPPRCIVTGENVDVQGMLAPGAWGKLNFVSEPCCRSCGYPFGFAAGKDSLCGNCLKEKPPYDSARAVLVYDDSSRDIILRFKHGDQTHTVPALASWLCRAGGDLLGSADLIVPVPLHRGRLLKRRYNQAALLALALARQAGKPCLADGLVRRRATPSQGHLGYKERYRNVRRAFAVNPRHRESLTGQSVILVDDVYTSGATAGECAKALRQAGVSQVHVLTLARVVKPEYRQSAK